MESKFTKGKWRCEPSEKYSNEFYLYTDTIGFKNGFVFGQQQANAQLIASAPEMFEELKETITDLKILRNQIEFESKSNKLFQGMPELMDRWIERKQQLLTKITSND